MATLVCVVELDTWSFADKKRLATFADRERLAVTKADQNVVIAKT
jgi:hypothetical protein